MSSSVLVVDDDVDLNRALTAQVRRAGHDVRSAFNGAEGLAALASVVPDAVLLDVQLGDMSGLDVLEVIRERYAGVVVILMTAQGSEEVAAMGLRLNADDYLRKPFRPAALFSSLDRALAQQALIRENESLRRQLAQRTAELERELMAGMRIQSALLALPAYGGAGVRIAARCRPARELGGDFFDYGPLPDGSAYALLGDVSGKGLPAALVMTLARSALRGALQRGTPDTAIAIVNLELLPDLIAMERFFTCFVCSIDPDARILRWADAGHGYAVLIRGGEVRELRSQDAGPPVGIVAEASYRIDQAALESGDQVLIFSDGLLERPELQAFADHSLLGPADTIRLLLASGGGSLDARMIFDLLVDDPHSPRRPARDDETALLIEIV